MKRLLNVLRFVGWYLFGEGRRMFANHFAVKADVYLHSGFYPSIFDQAAQQQTSEADHESHAEAHAEEHGHDHDHDHSEGHECPECHKCNSTFMGEPRDWLEKLGRNFMVTEHTHLEGGSEREILPWLKLSAQLDPQRIETYTVASYWLSEHLNQPEEAEKFLREGLRANPQSYEILLDLGRLYEQRFHQPERARGVWRLALRRWDETEAGKDKPDKIGRSSILSNLAESELKSRNLIQGLRSGHRGAEHPWFYESPRWP